MLPVGGGLMLLQPAPGDEIGPSSSPQPTNQLDPATRSSASTRHQSASMNKLSIDSGQKGDFAKALHCTLSLALHPAPLLCGKEEKINKKTWGPGPRKLRLVIIRCSPHAGYYSVMTDTEYISCQPFTNIQHELLIQSSMQSTEGYGFQAQAQAQAQARL